MLEPNILDAPEKGANYQQHFVVQFLVSVVLFTIGITFLLEFSEFFDWNRRKALNFLLFQMELSLLCFLLMITISLIPLIWVSKERSFIWIFFRSSSIILLGLVLFVAISSFLIDKNGINGFINMLSDWFPILVILSSSWIVTLALYMWFKYKNVIVSLLLFYLACFYIGNMI